MNAGTIGMSISHKGHVMQRITPCLWFDNKAEEAARFYVSIFKHSKLGPITRYGEAGAKVSGKPTRSREEDEAPLLSSGTQ